MNLLVVSDEELLIIKNALLMTKKEHTNDWKLKNKFLSSQTTIGDMNGMMYEHLEQCEQYQKLFDKINTCPKKENKRHFAFNFTR